MAIFDRRNGRGLPDWPAIRFGFGIVVQEWATQVWRTCYSCSALHVARSGGNLLVPIAIYGKVSTRLHTVQIVIQIRPSSRLETRLDRRFRSSASWDVHRRVDVYVKVFPGGSNSSLIRAGAFPAANSSSNSSSGSESVPGPPLPRSASSSRFEHRQLDSNGPMRGCASCRQRYIF